MKKVVFRAFLVSPFVLATLICAMFVADSKAVESLLKLDKKWTGDLDGMVERQLIRALVPYSKTFYFIDRGEQRGLTYEALKGFEKHVNKHLAKKTLKVRLVVILTRRDRLLPGLVEGLGDIAAGNLTITPERQELVDFSDPIYTDVDEIIVTGPTSPPVKTIEDLSGKEIHVRTSSSYHESVKALNARFKEQGKEPAVLLPADEYLEDEDLLEMVNASLIAMIAIDSHKGKFWMQIFKDLALHPEIKVRSGGQIGWAIRKNSPKLKKTINAFVNTHKKGTKGKRPIFADEQSMYNL